MFFTTNDKTPVTMWWAYKKSVTVLITDQPSNGTLKVSSNNAITYTPKVGSSGKDNFVWKAKYKDGTAFTATVEVTVNCVTCSGGGSGSAAGAGITVSWSRSSGQVDGYRVYFGTSSGTVTTLLSDLDVGSGEVNASSPSKTYSNLGLKSGDYACFRVRAYNSAGNSSYSSVKCGQV